MSSASVNLGSNVSSGGGGGGTVTQVSGNAPISVANETTTPVISITQGNLTDAGTDGIVITGGTGAVMGSGTSLAQHVADTTHNGYLASTDWNTFNSKLSSQDGSYSLANTTDATKLQKFDLSGQTTGTTLTLTPQITSNMVLHIPPVATAGGSAMALLQDETTGFIFSSGITSSIGAANSMMQLANATVANRAQIKLHSYFNGTSVSGVSTLTSRSGTIGTNAAVVAGQDYSKWTAQACATTPGSAPISGTFSFKANTVNSLTVTSDFHIQLTNLAGTLGDRLYLGSEGALQLPHYTAGFAQFDSSGNITSVSITATNVSYTAGTPSNWASTPPTTVQSAIDRMASLLQTLNGGTPIP